MTLATLSQLGIEHKGLGKEALRKKAYKENAIEKWEKLHPDKKRKPPQPGSGGGGGGIPGMEGMNGMDDLLRQMKGDFSGEKDPERRRLLQKMAASGISMGGGTSMTTAQLREMAKMMDGIKRDPGASGAPGAAADDELKTESDIDEGIADEDKMEL